MNKNIFDPEFMARAEQIDAILKETDIDAMLEKQDRQQKEADALLNQLRAMNNRPSVNIGCAVATGPNSYAESTGFMATASGKDFSNLLDETQVEGFDQNNQTNSSSAADTVTSTSARDVNIFCAKAKGENSVAVLNIAVSSRLAKILEDPEMRRQYEQALKK
jgi:hypothetical protein